MIKAIVFDCFGVLTGDKWKEFVAKLPKPQQRPAQELNRALDRGQLSLQDFTGAIHKLTGQKPEQVEAVINAEMLKNEELISYIKELKQNYKIGLLSNVSSNWIRDSFLTATEVKLFDDFVLSYEVKLIKPDPAIYPLVAERLGVDSQSCLLVDDGVSNCQGAIDAGMQAILYKDFAQFKTELEKILAADTNNNS